MGTWNLNVGLQTEAENLWNLCNPKENKKTLIKLSKWLWWFLLPWFCSSVRIASLQWFFKVKWFWGWRTRRHLLHHKNNNKKKTVSELKDIWQVCQRKWGSAAAAWYHTCPNCTTDLQSARRGWSRVSRNVAFLCWLHFTADASLQHFWSRDASITASEVVPPTNLTKPGRFWGGGQTESSAWTTSILLQKPEIAAVWRSTGNEKD